jgi:hypothetical protein
VRGPSWWGSDILARIIHEVTIEVVLAPDLAAVEVISGRDRRFRGAA